MGITEEENCRFFNFYTEICFTNEGCQISKDLEYFYSEIHLWMKEAGKKKLHKPEPEPNKHSLLS